MSKVFRIQPSPVVDHITEDGMELTQLPYPWYADEEGFIQSQDFWEGNPYKVLGFQKSLYVQALDLRWLDAIQDPSKAVGMYMVAMDKEGVWSVRQIAIQEMHDITEE